MSSVQKIKYLFLFITLKLFAQKPIVNSYEYKLYSKALSEERTIQVQLPKNYNDSLFAQASYPVMYVLDGDFNFQFITALERFNTKFLYRSQPEMIIIGINNIDRTRDFTPTKNNKKGHFKNSGGAIRFIKFIAEELQPHINSIYRTNGYDILWGHSFSGLFTMYTLFEQPNLFDSYIAIDPSLWWDDAVLLKKAIGVNLTHKNLFLAIGNTSEKEKQAIAHTRAINQFCNEILSKTSKDTFRSLCKYYPKYNHGEVPISGTVDALKFLFEGIELPVKEIPKNPILVKKNYEALSKKLHFELYPDESLLWMLIQFCFRSKKDAAAYKLLAYALQLYPTSKQLQNLKKHHEE